jgi:hypothetical protein
MRPIVLMQRTSRAAQNYSRKPWTNSVRTAHRARSMAGGMGQLRCVGDAPISGCTASRSCRQSHAQEGRATLGNSFASTAVPLVVVSRRS